MSAYVLSCSSEGSSWREWLQTDIKNMGHNQSHKPKAGTHSLKRQRQGQRQGGGQGQNLRDQRLAE
eukprot:11162165-Lingulodinium_polyedra.AAC.1